MSQVKGSVELNRLSVELAPNSAKQRRTHTRLAISRRLQLLDSRYLEADLVKKNKSLRGRSRRYGRMEERADK